MESSAERVAAGQVAASFQRRRPDLLHMMLYYLGHKPLGAFGLGIVLFVGLVAVTADFSWIPGPWNPPGIDRYDPKETLVGGSFDAPNWDHWFGTDQQGRDQYSRVVHGARISLQVGFMAVLIGTGAGALIGLISGYFMGWFDAGVQRLVDIMMSFPDLILALTIVAIFEQSLWYVILAISVTIFPRGVRIIRSSTISVREMDYVLSARAIGAESPRIIFRHVMPNTVAPFLIIMSSMFGTAILTEAGLSFLGLGDPTQPSFGTLLSGANRTHANSHPWLIMPAGVAITTVVLGFAFAGDALRDILDPKLRGR